MSTELAKEACLIYYCQIDRPIQWNVMEHNGKSIQNSGWFGMQTSWSFWKVLKTIAESFQKLSGQSPAVYIGHTYPDRKDRTSQIHHRYPFATGSVDTGVNLTAPLSFSHSSRFY